MTIKFLKLSTYIIIGVTTAFSGCKKHFGCAENVYNFEIGVKASPDKDIITIGDTIWLEINAPTTFKDATTGSTINYNMAANLGSAISIIQFLNKDSVSNAVNNFSYILNKGTQVNNPMVNKIREYNFVEENNAYSFKLGVIPQKNGIYGLIFSNATNVYRKTDECTKASFTINFKETNQHYSLNPNFQGGPTPNGGDYYFQVK